ncbi:ABC transporter ATP-binding protein [Nocardiopsis sp. NRRL B-16309]|uniref:ABC transporter ATP-binding protein n=1 Tax=Nocardiopsis sp. NRRL B-16309 TaxID=1519494 RepID=UPI0006AE52B4|nr:ATP-binding cassette domain-containing protein [Nocardiopsis sp. NRRL B-16309]KOX17315.1 hypothetical protein ADL05_09430 [Nocardiopsis sp. NRRL B-16309]
MTTAPILRVDDLTVTGADGTVLVDGFSLAARAGETVALTGPSGCGKTTAVLGLLDALAPGTRRVRGRVRWRDAEVRPGRAARRWRRTHTGVLTQDPVQGLNPLSTVGTAVREGGGARASLVPLLSSLGLDAEDVVRRRTHTLSGGQAQRVALARAVLSDPPLLVLDEPTSGLDAAAVALVAREIGRRRARGGLTLVVSHDPEFTAAVADRVLALGPAATRPVERPVSAAGADRPAVRLTSGAMASARTDEGRVRNGTRPAHATSDEPAGPSAPHLTDVQAGHEGRARNGADPAHGTPDEPDHPPVPRLANVRAGHDDRARNGTRPALGSRGRPEGPPVLRLVDVDVGHPGRPLLDGVRLDLRPGEMVAVTGPSGSGKSTLLRAVAGLHTPSSGRVLLHGRALAPTVGARDRAGLRAIQFVAQDPAGALNPAHTAASAVARPLRVLRSLSASDARAGAAALLDRVGLDADAGHRGPGALSGGQRQRVALARALAAGPDVLLADEITSALDPGTTAAVLDLLRDLCRSGLAVLVATHEPGVAARADRILTVEGRSLRLPPTEPRRTETIHARP